jgi:hypothetical protein
MPGETTTFPREVPKLGSTHMRSNVMAGELRPFWLAGSPASSEQELEVRHPYDLERTLLLTAARV